MHNAVFTSVLSVAIALTVVADRRPVRGHDVDETTGPVILLRHADATVGRDGPDTISFGDCTTQRNLSDTGREQARRVGEEFRAAGVHVGKVLASPMCRAYETASLLGIGPVERAPEFADLTNNARTAERLIEAEREIISQWTGPGALLIVTHSSNIKVLANRDIGPAETVVLDPPAKPRKFASLGR